MEHTGTQHRGIPLAAPLAAALGCLQPGIDPVFLTLLSQASRLPSDAYGWIVGGTQGGAAIGSLLVWRFGSHLPQRAILLAPLIALCCSMATPLGGDLTTILPIRCSYGLAMGTVYAHAMTVFAAHRPNHAFGAVFLAQLVLSTLVSLALPMLEAAMGAGVALAALALAPATALAALMLMQTDGTIVHPRPNPATPAATSPAAAAAAAIAIAVPAAGWALAGATFWFVCATMLIWSFSAALATAAGIADGTIGAAVAIGSISGALTALAVMRERVVVPLPLTALLASAALLSPIVLTGPDRNIPFVIAIVLLNIGSTAIIIRCSGLAATTSTDPHFRTFVACTHSLGLIAGPLLGSAMLALFGADGLLGGLLFALGAGLATVLGAVFLESEPGRATAPERIAETVRMSLD